MFVSVPMCPVFMCAYMLMCVLVCPICVFMFMCVCVALYPVCAHMCSFVNGCIFRHGYLHVFLYCFCSLHKTQVPKRRQDTILCFYHICLCFFVFKDGNSMLLLKNPNAM